MTLASLSWGRSSALDQRAGSVVKLPRSSVGNGQIKGKVLIELHTRELGDDGLIVSCCEKDLGNPSNAILELGSILSAACHSTNAS